MTTRGFREDKARLIAHLIADMLDNPHNDARITAVREFVNGLASSSPVTAKVRRQGLHGRGMLVPPKHRSDLAGERRGWRNGPFELTRYRPGHAVVRRTQRSSEGALVPFLWPLFSNTEY
jgi:hypothetical protein